VFATSTWAQAASDAEAKPLAHTEAVHAEGTWATTDAARGGAAVAGQRGRVEALRLADNEVRGRIALTGVPQLSAANLEARLSGRGLSGRVVDDEGLPLAYFEGAVSASGASGTFRYRGGGSGSWSWDGTRQE